jgi:hypothetical protein
MDVRDVTDVTDDELVHALVGRVRDLGDDAACYAWYHWV